VGEVSRPDVSWDDVVFLFVHQPRVATVAEVRPHHSNACQATHTAYKWEQQTQLL